MNKYALIKDNMVFQIVESEKKPDWPVMADGHKPQFVLVPEGETVEAGFTYDKKTGKFTPYEGYDPNPHEPVLEEQTVQYSASEILLAKAYGVELDITPQILSAALADVPVVELVEAEEWRAGVKVSGGQNLSYKGLIYTVIEGKGHITQTGWEPDVTRSLFNILSQNYDDWIQPTGAHNAYSIGDIRRYNDILYISQINSNTTIPGSDERWWKVYEQ